MSNTLMVQFPVSVLRVIRDSQIEQRQRVTYLRFYAMMQTTRKIWRAHVEQAAYVFGIAEEGQIIDEAIRIATDEELNSNPDWHITAEDCGLRHYESESDVYTFVYGVCLDGYPSEGSYSSALNVHTWLAQSCPSSGDTLVIMPLRYLFWDLSWNQLSLFCAIHAAIGDGTGLHGSDARARILRTEWLQALASGYKSNKITPPDYVPVMSDTTVTNVAKDLHERKLIHRQYNRLNRRDTWYGLQWQITEPAFQQLVKGQVVKRSIRKSETKAKMQRNDDAWEKEVKRMIEEERQGIGTKK